MRWILELVSEPEIEALELAQMKRELREFDSVTSRDDDITAKIKSAREWVEDFTGRVLVDETWRLSIERTGSLFTTDPDVGRVFSGAVGPTRDIYLRRSPILAITSVVTVDAEGVETTVDAADYQLRDADSRWPMLVPINSSTWGSANIRITFRAGFADMTGSPQDDASVVPERFKQAMILWVKSNYDDDPASFEAAKNLAMPLRAHVGFA
jgi:hypothetical protein